MYSIEDIKEAYIRGGEDTLASLLDALQAAKATHRQTAEEHYQEIFHANSNPSE